MAGALTLRGLAKRFGDEVAVDGIDLEIEAGEFFSLLGSSGCGKTTTLRMIAGFEKPDAGSIHLDGRDLSSVPPHRRPVNTVFQSYALFPFLSVFDNVAFGLRYSHAGKEETRRRVGKALELVQMRQLAQRKPHQLSGGQQQRVALARALVLEPTVLLLDEPMGALDAKLRKQLQVELRSLQRVVGTTFVYVTHDQEEALTMSDRLAVLDAGQVLQVGAPSEVYSQPQNTKVAAFLGSANLFPATVEAVAGDEVRCRLADLTLAVAPGRYDVGVGQRVSVMIRPERIEVAPVGVPAAPSEPGQTYRVDGKVAVLTFRGAATGVSLDCGAFTLEAQVPNVHGEPPSWLGVGSAVVAAFSRSAVRLLPT